MNGIEGNVVVPFAIDAKGTLHNIRILQSPDSCLSEATIAVLERSNKLRKGWKPGRQRGKPVQVSFTLPEKFAIPEDKK